MNVLIITGLYPESENHTVEYISWAVRELVIGLSRFDIHVKKVIRPMSEISWKKVSRQEVFTTSIIDGIKVETKSFINLPKSGFYLTWNDLKYIESSLEDVDLIVAHMLPGAYLSNAIYKKFKVDFLYVLHNNDLKSLHKQKEILRNAKAIYTRSWALDRHLSKAGFFSRGIVYSGIDKSLIIEHLKKAKKVKSKLSFISVHRLQKLKNTDITIKALSQLPAEYDWEYKIIGDGAEYQEIMQLIKTLNIESKVKMLGFRDRDFCINEMKKSDVFVMPSAPETFGLAYLEAMAAGCIVIGAKGWGIDGLIKNGFDGYLVEPRDIDALKKLFINLFTKDQTEVLKNSRDTIRRFTLDEAQKNYADLIKMNLS